MSEQLSLSLSLFFLFFFFFKLRGLASGDKKSRAKLLIAKGIKGLHPAALGTLPAAPGLLLEQSKGICSTE